jgi:hypothetical protein
MSTGNRETPLETLQDIRNMMERSSRFISLSGWSGIWAGGVALAGSWVAGNMLKQPPLATDDAYIAYLSKFVILALMVFLVALAGAFYFTSRKAKAQGQTIWGSASRRVMTEIAIPLVVGAVFAFHFLFKGHAVYIAPVCLAFYGLALINSSKYTLSDIKYLGLLEVALACINLYMPGFGLIFWAAGFGVLHILYGLFMWNKYDKRNLDSKDEE